MEPLSPLYMYMRNISLSSFARRVLPEPPWVSWVPWAPGVQGWGRRSPAKGHPRESGICGVRVSLSPQVQLL